MYLSILPLFYIHNKNCKNQKLNCHKISRHLEVYLNKRFENVAVSIKTFSIWSCPLFRGVR